MRFLLSLHCQTVYGYGYACRQSRRHSPPGAPRWTWECARTLAGLSLSSSRELGHSQRAVSPHAAASARFPLAPARTDGCADTRWTCHVPTRREGTPVVSNP
eukprot:scaffold209_cov396-Prasinococcus_capsulatus_cf.AAC.17